MSDLAKAIKGGEFILTGDCCPPRGADPSGLKECAAGLKGFVNAINVPESEDGPRMSSLAACKHILDAGAEPILHLLTRDLNRIALQATILGAASLGVRNVLCLAGHHQTLTSAGDARGVFDVDPIQLLRIADGIRKGGTLSDGESLDAPIELLLGTDTNPFSDPMDLQVIALDRAVAAGSDFIITQPVFNTARFEEWMAAVRDRGIHERTCIIASVLPLKSSDEASRLVIKYRSLDIPDTSAVGVEAALKTAAFLKSVEGVRGIHVSGESSLVTEVLKSIKQS
jgi:methylenetetrahydrofolate reductase (NADPH)